MATSRSACGFLRPLPHVQQLTFCHCHLLPQGTVLDRIDYNVEQSCIKTEDGLKQLHKVTPVLSVVEDWRSCCHELKIHQGWLPSQLSSALLPAITQCDSADMGVMPCRADHVGCRPSAVASVSRALTLRLEVISLLLENTSFFESSWFRKSVEFAFAKIWLSILFACCWCSLSCRDTFLMNCWWKITLEKTKI